MLKRKQIIKNNKYNRNKRKLKLVRKPTGKRSSRNYIRGVQINLGIGVAIGGFVWTMINTLSEHLAKYYNWKDSEK